MDSQAQTPTTDISAVLADALSNRRVSERSRIVRGVADLFLNNSASYSNEQVNLFDTVMMKLVDQIDQELRQLLSNRLASVDNPPLEVIRHLANDDAIVVARPLLTRSSCLDEEFLIASAKSKSQEHLVAISSRQTIGPRVTDILVDRGNDQVALTLAGNDGANFSDRGYSAMVERAKDSQQLARIVWNRSDIPRQQALALFEKASAAVRKALEVEDCKKVQEISAAVRLASQKLQEKSLESSAAYANAKSRVAALQKTGGLSESHILTFARQGEFEEVVTAVSEISRLSAADTERMIVEETNDRLFIVSKAIGLSWICVRQILLMNQTKPRVSEQLEQLQLKYQSISRESASKTLQVHQLRKRARSGQSDPSICG